jgi:hypothetical protein
MAYGVLAKASVDRHQYMYLCVKSSTVGIPLRYWHKRLLCGVIQQPYINQCSLLFGGRYTMAVKPLFFFFFFFQLLPSDFRNLITKTNDR